MCKSKLALFQGETELQAFPAGSRAFPPPQLRLGALVPPTAFPSCADHRITLGSQKRFNLGCGEIERRGTTGGGRHISLSVIAPFYYILWMGNVAGVDQSNPFIIRIEDTYLN